MILALVICLGMLTIFGMPIFVSILAGAMLGLTASQVDHSAILIEISRLANSPVELEALRQKIAHNRMSASLFDTPRFVRNLEKAYKEMWAIFSSGKRPRKIEVVED